MDNTQKEASAQAPKEDEYYLVCPGCNGNGRGRDLGWIVFTCHACNGCGIVMNPKAV